MKIECVVLFIAFGVLSGACAQNAAEPEAVHSLFLAATTGDLLTVHRILESGTYVDEPDPLFMMMTPLMAAARHGRTDTMLLLLEHGANPDCVDRLGRTALALSAAASQHRAVEILIRHGCDVDRADAMGRTPLMRAAASGSSLSVMYLFDAGADPGGTSKKGMTVADYAAESGNTETIKLIGAICMQSD